MPEPTRRDVLRALTATGIAVLTSRCLPWSPEPRGETEQLLLAVARLIPIPDLLAVGQAYLASVPDEADADALLQSVFGELSFEEKRQGSFLDSCQQRFRSDFENGDTVIADGWLISRSEARFCALIHLDQPS